MAGPGREGSGTLDKRNLLALLALAVLQLVLLWPFRGYFTDDTFIHLQFARNLALSGEFAFNVGEPTYGFTSPAWVVLLALWDRIGGDPLVGSKVLGGLFTIAATVGFRVLAGSVLRTELFRWLATLSFALDAWLLRWAFSGMETSLAVCAVVWSLALHAQVRKGNGSLAAAGLVAGLSVVCRPECLGLVLVFFLDLILVSRVGVGRIVPWFAGVAALGGTWLGFARLEFGQWLPNTAHAKSGSFVLDWDAFGLLLRREVQVVGATRVWEVGWIGFGCVVFLVAALRGRAVEARKRVSRYGWLMAWAIGIPLVFALRNTFLLSRYFLLVVPAIVALGWLVFESRVWLRARAGAGGGAGAGVSAGVRAGGSVSTGVGPGRRRGLAILFFAAVAAQNLVVLFGLAYPHTREFPAGLNDSVRVIGTWLRENTEPGTAVATPDIGLLGYVSERRIVDVSGLVTPELIDKERLRTTKVEDFIADLGFRDVARPEYLVDRSIFPSRLRERTPHGAHIEPVMTRRVGRIGLARSLDFYYTLYRIDWSGVGP